MVIFLKTVNADFNNAKKQRKYMKGNLIFLV